MRDRPAVWFRNLAAGALLIALAMIPAVEMLLHGSLPLWLHIPLTLMALTLMGLGAGVAGVAYLEYQARSGDRGQKA